MLTESKEGLLLARGSPAPRMRAQASPQGSPFSTENQFLFSAGCTKKPLIEGEKKKRKERDEIGGRKKEKKTNKTCDSALGKSQHSATTAER